MRCELLVIAALFSTTAFAQGWREVRTPPTRRDAFQMYQFVAPLDAGRWQGVSHEQSATATVTAGEGRQPGQGGLRISLVIALTSGAEKVFWYDFMDDGEELTYNEHNFGLVHHPSFALAPKPADVAYAHLIGLLQGKRLVTDGVTQGGLWRALFQGGDQRVTITWAEDQTQRFTVPIPSGAQVQDMFGRPIPTDGTLEVTWDPVFVVSR